jgi:hypothetical protein
LTLNIFRMISFLNFFAVVLRVSLVLALATPSEDIRNVDLAKRGALLSTQYATDGTVNISDALSGPLNSLGSHSRAGNPYLTLISKQIGGRLIFDILDVFFSKIISGTYWRLQAVTLCISHKYGPISPRLMSRFSDLSNHCSQRQGNFLVYNLQLGRR